MAGQERFSMLDFLTQLSENMLQRLYTDPWTCQAVIRLLPTLSQHYVLRLLFVDEENALPDKEVAAWVRDAPEAQKAHVSALKTLRGFHIITEEGGVVRVNSLFRSNLQTLLTGSKAAPYLAKPPRKNTRHPPPTSEQLKQYSRDRWESILRFMVGSLSESSEWPSQAVVELLVQTELMAVAGDSFRITREGFQFLLKNVYTQIWTLLLAYIRKSSARVEVLSFLFRLSFLEAGKEYSVSKKSLSAAQIQLVKDLRQFGLIYMRKEISSRYVPTRLAVNLMSGVWDKFADEVSGTKSYIIVETNYKVYAYTSSELQIALLSLFVHLQYRLPNLAVGLVTRESVRSALINGITAEQIIEYLNQHAHEKTETNFTRIPETVAAQIRIWESERNRVQFDQGVLYEKFDSDADFELVVEYATEHDYVIWTNAEKRLLFIREDGHELVRRFVKNHLA